ncbi:hypothetical protein OG618_22800 [Kitasatospora sp. NBC_01246]|uniref:hypothetical protein n=1 Tax=Kitasatospora sp. NBC_01246 TaxID=2903570 RepID=UPI002E2FE5B5|nr:hypothetical protein [Kitasatospora sp. NBC_01246]
MAGRESSAQIWGAAVVVVSALAVVAAYLINGAVLVLGVAGVEVLLLMVYVGRRWQQLHQQAGPRERRPARRHRPGRGRPDPAHCERCRRAREALDARQAGSRPYGVREQLIREYPVRGFPAPERRTSELPGHAHSAAGLTGHGHSAPGLAGHDHSAAELPGHDRAARERAARERPGGERPGHDGAAHERGDRRPGRPGPEWTAERAAARSLDRPTARRGAPGSAGRAVRHQ